MIVNRKIPGITSIFTTVLRSQALGPSLVLPLHYSFSKSGDL